MSNRRNEQRLKEQRMMMEVALMAKELNDQSKQTATLMNAISPLLADERAGQQLSENTRQFDQTMRTRQSEFDRNVGLAEVAQRWQQQYQRGDLTLKQRQLEEQARQADMQGRLETRKLGQAADRDSWQKDYYMSGMQNENKTRELAGLTGLLQVLQGGNIVSPEDMQQFAFNLFDRNGMQPMTMPSQQNAQLVQDLVAYINTPTDGKKPQLTPGLAAALDALTNPQKVLPQQEPRKYFQQSEAPSMNY
jgi:hypothetical protein